MIRLPLCGMLLAALLSGQDLPEYKPVRHASGAIRIWGHGAAGHDFIETLVRKWEAGFQKYQPDVTFDNRLYGTASAIGALYSGAGDLALLGREIWPSEIAAFREVFHYDPTEIEILTGSFDIRNKDFALTVFVHKDNPLTKLSFRQLDAIFGAEHRRGAANIRSWRQLDLLDGQWPSQSIHAYGFGISRGFGYYMEQTVFRGSAKWNVDMREFSDEKQPDGTLLDAGRQITDALAIDPYGIAYASMLYANPRVKALALSVTDSGPYVAPSVETVRNRSYPLARVIPMFLNREPGKPADLKLFEFLSYILSREGQQVVVEDGGYLPLTPWIARRQMDRLR